MFEQPLYEFEPVAAAKQDSDLFQDYEIKSWVFTPRVVRIVAISAVVNIVALLVVGQTSLLTLKGCDSPLVGSVCQVLDTVYVGALLFGTDREYVDVAYDKTDLNDAEITYIDVSNIAPPFEYPGEYFLIANPEKFATPEVLDDLSGITRGIPGIPDGLPLAESSGDSLFDTPQKLPTPNPNVLEGDLGGNYNNGGGVYFPPIRSNRPRRPKKPKISATPPDEFAGYPDDDDVAKLESPSSTPTPVQTFEPTPTPDGDVKEDKNGVYINKRPLTDMAKTTLDQLTAGRIKLDATFKVGATGTIGLAKDGKTVVLKNGKAIPPENGVQNHPAIEKFVQDWITSLGVSGLLGYLDRLDEKKTKEKRVRIMLEQNDTEFFATVNAEQPDENTAKMLASGLNLTLAGGQLVADGDELLFLKAASTTFDKNVLTLNFRIPKPIVQEMIQRYLDKEKAQPKPTDNNATTKPAANPAQN